MTSAQHPTNLHAEPNDAHEDALLKLSPDASIQAHLQIAKRAFASGEVDLRRGAEHVAQAVEKGATQRQAAEGVGKSPAWVNRLLRWRADDYRDDTPFGPEAKSKRERARVQASKHETLSVKTLDASETIPAKIFAMGTAEIKDTPASHLIEDAILAVNKYIPKRRLSETATLKTAQRKELIEYLDLLCNCVRPVMRSKLALIVEKRRAVTGLTWDQLIVPALDDVEPLIPPLIAEND